MTHTPLPLNRLYLAHAHSEPSFGDTPETLFYLRQADGKRSIVGQSTVTGLAQTLTTEPLPAGGISYGAGVYTVQAETLVYAAKDGTLQGMDLASGEQWAITPAYEGVAAPAISPCGQFVAFLAEQGGHCNVLLADVRGQTLPIKLSSDPWYAFNPVFSPDGRLVAWQEWNEYDMPWDEARLVIARLAKATGDSKGSYELLPLTPVNTFAKPRVSYASPQFSPDGKYLAYTSDETGWRSLWVARADGSNAVRVDAGEGEIGRADWVPGLCAMRWSGDGQTIYTIRRRQSRDVLLRVSWPENIVEEIPTNWLEMVNLNVRDDQLAFIGATPTTPHAVITLDALTGHEAARATNSIGLVNPGALSQPEVISWETVKKIQCWGIFYPAVGLRAEQNPRPLIVHIHGGPTSEVPFTWQPQAQYFATRGWHYLFVNHRGGTGYGRAYQEMLNGQWGVVDVEDARTGAQHLIDLGHADPRRLVITGGSAGGYTTLMALTQDSDFWAAGVSLYGIGDMYDLKQGSHRFEVNYEEGSLLGRLPEAGAVWKARSPLTHVKNVRRPVLLFHGLEDKAVPYQQSVDFAEAVKKQGGLAELVSYADEGHGFVKEANRRDNLERMEKFLEKHVLALQ